MTVGGTQMPPRVSTGDRDAVLRQIRWCAAVQTLVNCHCHWGADSYGPKKPRIGWGGAHLRHLENAMYRSVHTVRLIIGLETQ